MFDAEGNEYCYLNATSNPCALEPDGKRPLMMSRLVEYLATTRQSKAPPAQWQAMLRGLPQKGIKQAEIEESGIAAWLQMAQESGVASLAAQELLKRAHFGLPTIKETILARPRYENYRTHKKNARGSTSADRYTETLYSLNSQRDDVMDEIREIELMLEEMQLDAGCLAFGMTRLMDDPELPQRMAQRMLDLKAMLPKAWDFPASHFSDAMRESGIRNIMAWSRVTVARGVMLIDEIQSDWAQQGRRKDWLDIPRAPFVTNTESWAGLVLRRTMQRGALDPTVRQVHWITKDMKNGWWDHGSRQEPQGMDKFYLEMLPRLADKLLKPLGAKTAILDHVMPDDSTRKVPGFEMTPQARAGLVRTLPLYSLSPVWESPVRSADDPAVQETLRQASFMVGNQATVRLARWIYDTAQAMPAAGRYADRVIEVSLRAKDMDMAAAHEVWHFAWDRLLTPSERAIVAGAFEPHTALARRTMAMLSSLGHVVAVKQCVSSPEECSAHAFSLWKSGRMVLARSPARSLFERVGEALEDLYHWSKGVVCSIFARDRATSRGDQLQDVDHGDHGGEQVLTSLERIRAQRDGESLAAPLFESVASGARAREARLDQRIAWREWRMPQGCESQPGHEASQGQFDQSGEDAADEAAETRSASFMRG